MKGNFARFILYVSLALNISMLSAAGYFFYRHHRHRMSPFAGMPKAERFIFEKIQLRPDQINAIKEKSAAFCTEIGKKEQEIVRLRKMLFFNLAMDNPDKKSIDTVIGDINKIQLELQASVSNHILEEKSILDDAQQMQFFDLLEKSLDKRKHFRCRAPEQKHG